MSLQNIGKFSSIFLKKIANKIIWKHNQIPILTLVFRLCFLEYCRILPYAILTILCCYWLF